MGLRRADAKVHLAPPAWYPGCISVSLVLHLGGECVHVPTAQYSGGKEVIYDHVSTDLLDFWTLENLLRQEGISEDEVECYLKVGDNFQLVEDEKKLQAAASKSIRQRTFHIYVAKSDRNVEGESGTGSGRGSDSKSGSDSGVDGTESRGQREVGADEGELVGGQNLSVVRACTDQLSRGKEKVVDEEPYDIDDEEENPLEQHDSFFLESEYMEDEDWEDIIDAYHEEGEDMNRISRQDEQAGGSGRGKELVVRSDGDSSDDDMVTAEDDFDERRLSDEEGDGSQPAPVFNPTEIYRPTITLEMLFGTRDEFRKAVRSLAVNEQRKVKFTRTTPTRVYAECQAEDCEWKIYAHKVQDAESLQVTRFESKHTCMQTHDVPALNSRWLSERFIQKFVSDPKRSAEGFRLDVINELKVDVTKHQAIAAKKLALQTLRGSSEYQFSRLWDYAEELRMRNPGSTVVVGTKNEGTKTRFDRFYACFGALKKGWRLGCRPIIGVDGCHLSGPHKGVLLTAVSVDPNNQLYPIAYAIIPIENKDNWGWFLSILKVDLQLDNVRYLTFISDRQKGLVQAMQEVLPSVDHRFCVRHMHNNFCTAGYRGLALKNLLWSAARSCTVTEFMAAMKKIKDYSEGAWKWLNERPPTQWSKSHFSEGPLCDMLLNNLCESFNGCIKEARDKTILTSLEWIREYIMKRHAENLDRATIKWSNKLFCPRIEKIVMRNARRVGDYIPIKASDRSYQIRMMEGDGQYVVDLVRRECSCRLWQLNGYPCVHGLVAISKQGNDPMHFVEKCYSVATYIKAYQLPIGGTSSHLFWMPTSFIPPCPPIFGRGVGRPPKSRNKSVDEPKKKPRPRRRQTKDPTKMTRRGTTSHCSRCGRPGHHVTTCPDLPDAQREGRRIAKARKGNSSSSSMGASTAAAQFTPQNSHSKNLTTPQVKRKKLQSRAPTKPPGGQATTSTQPSLLPPLSPDATEEAEEAIEEPVITQDYTVAAPILPGPSIHQQMMGLSKTAAEKTVPTNGGSWRAGQFRVGKSGPPIHYLCSRKQGGSKE